MKIEQWYLKLSSQGCLFQSQIDPTCISISKTDFTAKLMKEVKAHFTYIVRNVSHNSM